MSDKIEFEAVIYGVDSNLPRSNPPDCIWIRIKGLPISENSLALEGGRESFGYASKVGDRLKITIERVTQTPPAQNTE